MTPTAVAAVSTVDPDERTIREAEDRGRRRQEVDSRLDDHDRHFQRINGSIDRGAKATERLSQTVQDLAQKVETAAVVQATLAKAAVSRRELWLAVAAIVAVLIAGWHPKL